MSEWAIVALVCLMSFVASFIQRTSGFGFGIVVMAVFPHLLASYGEATALSGVLAALTSVVTAIKMRKMVSWKKLLPILLTFLVFSYFATGFMAHVSGGEMKHVLGAVLIVVSLYFFFLADRIHLRPGLPLQVGMGTLSGVMGGLFAMQGPPAVIYFISSSDTTEEYIAMTQWYFFVGNAMMTVYRSVDGLVTGSVRRLRYHIRRQGVGAYKTFVAPTPCLCVSCRIRRYYFAGLTGMLMPISGKLILAFSSRTSSFE